MTTATPVIDMREISAKEVGRVLADGLAAHAANVARIAELEALLQHVVDMVEGDPCAEYQPMLDDIRAVLGVK